MRKVSLCPHLSQVLTLRPLRTVQNKRGGEMGASGVVKGYSEFFLLLYYPPTPNPRVIPQSTHWWPVSVHLVHSHSGKRKTVLTTIPDHKIDSHFSSKEFTKAQFSREPRKTAKADVKLPLKMFARIHPASDTEPDLWNIPP